MLSAFEKDFYRYVGSSYQNFSTKLRYVPFTPGIVYIYFFRKAQTSRFSLIRALSRGLLQITKIITGIQIPVETHIGYGFRILHFGTIVINPEAKIGNNFTIAQGALIGGDAGKRKGFPTIGNNCMQCANSIIVGGVTIGNNVLIAPGAFINFDVPDNSIVIGNPGKIIPRDESPTKKHIVYSSDDII